MSLSTMFIKIVFIFLLISYSVGLDNSMYRSITAFRDCLKEKFIVICFKEKALNVLNESMTTDKPITFYGMIDIERNPEFNMNLTDDQLPDNISARSLKLNEILYRKVEEFFKSRIIKFNLAPAFEDEEGEEEGRGKKGGKGKGGMLMMGMIGMACMVGQLMMGKIAFMAGTALIIAKVALFLSAIVGIKKLAGGSGGGGETQHVVYTSGGDYGHSHGGGGGGGGWHRSLDNDIHNIVYRAHATEEANGL